MLGVRVPPGLQDSCDIVVLKKIEKYFKETAAELRRMTWPTKDELVGSTIVTVVVSLIVAIFIGIVDWILVRAMTFVFTGGA